MSIIEIRAAEGGDDAKLLVCEQFRIYFKFARRLQVSDGVWICKCGGRARDRKKC